MRVEDWKDEYEEIYEDEYEEIYEYDLDLDEDEIAELWDKYD